MGFLAQAQEHLKRMVKQFRYEQVESSQSIKEQTSQLADAVRLMFHMVFIFVLMVLHRYLYNTVFEIVVDAIF